LRTFAGRAVHETDLHRLVAVDRRRLALHDDAGAGLDDRRRNDRAVLANSCVIPIFLPMIPVTILGAFSFQLPASRKCQPWIGWKLGAGSWELISYALSRTP
jgi:hypothetical protein